MARSAQTFIITHIYRKLFNKFITTIRLSQQEKKLERIKALLQQKITSDIKSQFVEPQNEQLRVVKSGNRENMSMIPDPTLENEAEAFHITTKTLRITSAQISGANATG